jgi:ABC-type sulfate transport system permease component
MLASARPARLMRPLFGPGRLLPGFRLSLGCAVLYLSLLVLLPLSGLVFKASQLSLDAFWDIASGERALASYRVTFGASLLAASINAVFGLIVAWVLVRYSFPGKRDRCPGRSALCAADGRCRDHSGDPLCR